jgi:Predicted transcriptional regulator
MFQFDGHSMYPTLQSGSYVVGEWLGNWERDVKDNKVYIIITNDGVVKRVINRIKKYNNLLLKSDNQREYPNLNIAPQEIIEI